MAYKVIRQPEFDAALAKKLSKNFNLKYLLQGLDWTLEHDPDRGTAARQHVRIAKITLAPIVVTVYYTVDHAKQRVYLPDIK